jgi:hypothetical protein
LVAPGISYSLRDAPRTRTRSFCEVAPKDRTNAVQYGGGGAPTTIISGFLGFEALSLKPITPLLPGFILIKADQARTLALHTTLQLLAAEMAEPSHSRSYCVGCRELAIVDGSARSSIHRLVLH